jgi:teichuronic acid biosynthesis glycosyltransferase TuaH
MGVDVIYALHAVGWTAAHARGLTMPEDRLAAELVDRRDVQRLIVAEPYRSFAGKARAYARRSPQATFPASASRALYSPLRWRRKNPTHSMAWVERYEAGLRETAARMGLDRPVVIAAHPLLAGFGRFEWAGPVTYYATDEFAAYRPHERWWPAYDRAYVRMRETGRRVCAVSQAILDRLAPSGSHAVIPNGVDPSEWLPPSSAPQWFRRLPRPRFTYVGTLDSRVDISQVKAVADRFQSGSITLVGRIAEPDHLTPLRDIANVTIRPPETRSAITGLIHESDCGLIPHVRNDLTRSMSPLKLFEYLAGGRPVAAVDLPPIVAVDHPSVALAAPGDDFAAVTERALDLGPASEDERRRFISQNAWSERFRALLSVATASD